MPRVTLCYVRRISVLTTAIASLLLTIGVSSGDSAALSQHPGTGVNRPRLALIPADGRTFFGVQLTWAVDSPKAYARRLGRVPAVFGDFAGFPLSQAALRDLSRKVDAVGVLHGMFMLTLMPNDGLASVTDQAVRALGRVLADYNRRGVPVFVRFGHEMNGSWYPWDQQPAAYVRAFRRVALVVHREDRLSFMVWAPSYGGGYPFAGGRYEARPGTPEFAMLDTNHDGRLTRSDDPYAAYYPGDAYVDWVGLTDYFWGNHYPWGQNELPTPRMFEQQLTGTYSGAVEDDRGLPNFYAAYALGHRKPFVLAETSALYNPDRHGGASDYAIKMAWSHQIFARDMAVRFPLFKMVLWLESYKYERETHSVLDWTVTRNRAVLDGFRHMLPSSLIFARRP